ncbi:MAG: hypothetical protein WCO63_16390 [Bacteroidota bacterium]
MHKRKQTTVRQLKRKHINMVYNTVTGTAEIWKKGRHGKKILVESLQNISQNDKQN